jgi:hypothetical protein
VAADELEGLAPLRPPDTLGPNDAVARPRAFDVPEPAHGALGTIEGRRDRAAESAAEPGEQGTGGDITGRRR